MKMLKHGNETWRCCVELYEKTVTDSFSFDRKSSFVATNSKRWKEKLLVFLDKI